VTVGLSAANLANAWLNTIRGGGNGTTFTAPAAIFAKQHTADPGAAGATAAGAVTTRPAVTFGAAAANGAVQQIALSNSPSWTQTATETITHLSFWDNATAGNFLFSAALTTPKSVVNTDTLTVNSVIVSLTPIAA
jgi:hypothetical protein